MRHHFSSLGYLEAVCAFVPNKHDHTFLLESSSFSDGDAGSKTVMRNEGEQSSFGSGR